MTILIAHITFCIPFAYLPIAARLQGIDEGVAGAQIAERLAEDASRLLATTQLGMMLTLV